MINYNDNLLFQNKINKRKLEQAHYIELKKYSKKVYKKDIISDLIVFTIMTVVIVVVGVGALCMIF